MMHALSALLAALSGLNWLAPVPNQLAAFAVGIVAALLVQRYIVSKLETRKRRENRWEDDVRSLDELLTVRLTSLANEASAAQLVYRDVRDDATGKYSPARVHERAWDAQEATWNYGGLIGTQVDLLIGRVLSINPKAKEIKRLKRLNGNYQQRAIFVRPLPEHDDRTDTEFDKTWDKESEARKALIGQVKLLAGMRHPPR